MFVVISVIIEISIFKEDFHGRIAGLILANQFEAYKEILNTHRIHRLFVYTGNDVKFYTKFKLCGDPSEEIASIISSCPKMTSRCYLLVTHGVLAMTRPNEICRMDILEKKEIKTHHVLEVVATYKKGDVRVIYRCVRDWYLGTVEETSCPGVAKLKLHIKADLLRNINLKEFISFGLYLQSFVSSFT